MGQALAPAIFIAAAAQQQTRPLPRVPPLKRSAGSLDPRQQRRRPFQPEPYRANAAARNDPVAKQHLARILLRQRPRQDQRSGTDTQVGVAVVWSRRRPGPLRRRVRADPVGDARAGRPRRPSSCPTARSPGRLAPDSRVRHHRKRPSSKIRREESRTGANITADGYRELIRFR